MSPMHIVQEGGSDKMEQMGVQALFLFMQNDTVVTICHQVYCSVDPRVSST